MTEGCLFHSGSYSLKPCVSVSFSLPSLPLLIVALLFCWLVAGGGIRTQEDVLQTPSGRELTWATPVVIVSGLWSGVNHSAKETSDT